MKAAVYRSYGPPEVVRIEEVEKPAPKDDEVLMRVRAASVNPYDWHFMRGEPYFLRAVAGLGKPRVTQLGVDAAGQVEAIGKSVSRWKVGDEVFGGARGAFAEYACAPETGLALKPDNVTFDQAATLPIAGITALQGLRLGGLNENSHRQARKVLINGAAGGVGTFAVQLAKTWGAEVTGVCSGRNAELVQSLGADRVIDYMREDFTRSETRYHIILDCIANHPLSECRRVLTPNGAYIVVGGKMGRWMIGFLGRLVKMAVLSKFGKQKLTLVQAKMRTEDLSRLGELMATEEMKAVIDRSYPLDQVAEAIRYVEQGHARGKVVLTMAQA